MDDWRTRLKPKKELVRLNGPTIYPRCKRYKCGMLVQVAWVDTYMKELFVE